MRRALWLVFVLLLAAPLVAQDAQPAPLTELEAVRVENLALKKQIVVRAMQDWQHAAVQLKADLERQRPGWVFNPEEGTWAAAKPPK